MKFHPVIFILIFLLVACNSVKGQITIIPSIVSTTSLATIPTQISKPAQAITPSITRTPQLTIKAVSTATPTITNTPVIWKTHVESTKVSAKFTVEAFGLNCEFPEFLPPQYSSSDGRWIPVQCVGENYYDFYVSNLQLIDTKENKDWIIPINNFTKGLTDFNSYPLYPYLWSRDGKFLYIVADSRMSGCCWIGGTLFLARLNLESGQVAVIFNFISDGSGIPGIDFSISKDERYVMYSVGNQLYLLDTLTWKQKLIELNYGNSATGYPLMSNDDSKIILVMRAYPEDYLTSQGDLTFGSLIVIDLNNGTQKEILSGYDWHDTPEPYKWVDSDHILLCKNIDSCGKNPYLLLDINTGGITEVSNP